jgi:hypothetical protein
MRIRLNVSNKELRVAIDVGLSIEVLEDTKGYQKGYQRCLSYYQMMVAIRGFVSMASIDDRKDQ